MDQKSVKIITVMRSQNKAYVVEHAGLLIWACRGVRCGSAFSPPFDATPKILGTAPDFEPC